MAKSPKRPRPVRIVQPREEEGVEPGQVRLVKNESGLLVPADSIEEPCGHAEVAERYAKRVVANRDVYHCKDCDQKVQLRVLQFGAKTEEEWKKIEEQYSAQAARIQMARQQANAAIFGEGDNE